ncbi:MAG TPA: peptidylprolyl isomerase [Bacteroidota bacterium]|nr:peptidylprolyl isomerase [Bacteroidota bacterium]
MRLLPRSTRALALAALLGAIPGCTGNHPGRPYVARVGSAELTEDEVVGPADSLARARGKSVAFINQWVVSELLYQEAERRGLADTDELRKQLEATRKRLAIEALLEREVYNAASDSIPADEITAAFRKNAAAFTLKEDVVRLSYALFGDRDAANQFRAALLKGSSWDEALGALTRDSARGGSLRTMARNQFFTQAMLFPDELWKLARTLPREEVSYPVKTPAGYYILRVHAIRHAGEAPEEEYARQEVRDRLLIDRRRARYEQLVSDLRARHKVEVNFNVVDTAGAGAD